MVKKQTLLHGVAFILWGTLILPVSAADNLHFSGSRQSVYLNNAGSRYC